MKKKIYFALIMALFTGSIVSFVALLSNIGFVPGFLMIWFNTFLMVYPVIVFCILLIGPLVIKLVDKISR